MKWVEKYLTTHHFFHAPHKWFWAVLLSPIHAGEVHYKQRYHLTFAHAKKLFFFDMLLFLSMGILIAGSIIWSVYDPTVLDNISLNMSASTDRIKAGQHVEYTITYANNSEKTLFDPVVALRLPEGFVIDSVEPAALFNTETRSLTLSTLHPNSNGTISIRGWFYGTPDGDERIVATLSYRAEDRSVREQKHVSILATLRGSLVTATLDLPDTIVSQGSVPFTLTIMNSEESPVRSLSIPLSFSDSITLEGTPTVSAGTIDKGTWSIILKDSDPVFTKATLTGMLRTSVAKNISKKDVSITPTVTVGGKTFAQTPAKRTVNIIHPSLDATVSWKEHTRTIDPGETLSATLVIKNTGDTALSNINIRMPLHGVVDIDRMKKENKGTADKDAFIISHTKHANLLSLPPGAETTLELIIPIKKIITSGEQIVFSLSPAISASVPSVPEAIYQTRTASEPIKIASALTLQAEIRYFTADGDQVGRGPLPPQVGKQTKYWGFIHLFNRTNSVDAVSLTTILAPGVTWTGKSSVSHGREAQYNAATRTITWTSPTLLPHSQAGLYLELAIIPNANQTGKTPVLITKISAEGIDSFTEHPLSASHPALDISVPRDKEARESGITVQ